MAASFVSISQLTTNSSELPVRTAAISPDGKRLAFSDIKGLHIKNIETGENSDVPFPQTTAGGRVDWQIMAWFPNGENFLANIAPFEDVCLHCEHFSAWVVPANGGVPQRLKDDANAESVSPDGSRIAFTADLGMPLPKRGYRFIGPVDWNGRQSPESGRIGFLLIQPCKRAYR